MSRLRDAAVTLLWSAAVTVGVYALVLGLALCERQRLARLAAEERVAGDAR